MIRPGLLLLAAMLAAAPAAARACSLPARICGDAALDARLAAKEREVAAATARPATWAARAARFRRWLATATDSDGQPLAAAALTGHIEDQIAQLDVELARARAIAPGAGRAAILGDKCLGTWLRMGCVVPASGVVRDGGATILWQFQSGASEENGVGMGAMLWDASGPGAPKLIGWTFEGYFMEMPRFNAETGLLWVAGRMSGTGEGNADMLFQKRGREWVEVEMESWRDDLTKRLPDQLGVWKGVEFDFLGTAMGADAQLWKPEDANCCPTGGRANLGFVIDGERLRLDTISAQLGGPAERWRDF